jgi:hypothetical protein
MSRAIPPLTQYAFMAWCSVKPQGQLYLLSVKSYHFFAVKKGSHLDTKEGKPSGQQTSATVLKSNTIWFSRRKAFCLVSKRHEVQDSTSHRSYLRFPSEIRTRIWVIQGKGELIIEPSPGSTAYSMKKYRRSFEGFYLGAARTMFFKLWHVDSYRQATYF